MYKEHALDVGEMKHEHEIDTSITSLSSKRGRIKLVEKLSTMVELRKIVFLGGTHGNMWALDTQEETWAKKVGLVSLKKFD